MLFELRRSATMQIINLFLKIFFYPGNYVIRKAGITIEEDGGILRSFVNMCVWSLVVVVCVAAFV